MPANTSFRFGLKAFIVFVSICGVLLGLLGKHLQQQRADQAAVREIRRMGGTITYSPIFDQKILFTDANRESSWRGRLFSQLRTITGVRLVGPRVTDGKLVALTRLSNVRRLGLGKTNITGEGLVHLRGLERLAHLDLQETGVGDRGLQYIRELTNLESLNLRQTSVTDAGLRHLVALKSLELIVLGETQVTRGGVEELRRLLPGTRIRFDPESTRNDVKEALVLVASVDRACTLNLNMVNDEADSLPRTVVGLVENNDPARWQAPTPSG